MDDRDQEFLNRLLATFKVEAEEHLKALSSGLIALEKAEAGDRTGFIETIYREVHSLKGAARSVNLADIVSICQAMESVFSSLKKNEIIESPQMLDLLHNAVDFTTRILSGDKIPADDKKTITNILIQLDNAAKGDREAVKNRGYEPAKIQPQGSEDDYGATQAGTAEVPVNEEIPAVRRSTPSPSSPASETVRISTVRLNSLLLQVEELLSVKLATWQRAAELRELKRMLDIWKKERVRTGIRSAETGKGHMAEAKYQASVAIAQAPGYSLSSSESIIASLESGLSDLVKTSDYDHRSVGMMVDNLLDDMKKALMLPFSSLLEMFPKFVRDLARDSGKKIEFASEGGEVEIDRRILEELKDPLIHLVRNCVDHGIENPEDRAGKMKPEFGTIMIRAISRDNKLEIVVSDDGSGLDLTKIRASAVKHGIVPQEEAERMGDRDAKLLMFRSGVTTSPIITDISGRGLGLAIVREKVERLNGTIAIDTSPDVGTTFTMVVPITLATFRGILVRAGRQLFIVPSVNVERAARVRSDEIRTIENRETLSFSGQTVPFCRLTDVLELKAGGPALSPLRSRDDERNADSLFQILVLGSAEKRMAFLVEDVLQEQEVLTKPLGRQLSRVRNIAGATVLGNGRVVPVLNVPDMLNSAVNLGSAPVKYAAEAVPDNGKSVLVVEDSITARTLLKNILETAGYDVTPAVDGMDALAALKTGKFDLVVSDVDMPRMNGFALTAKIRGDNKLSELPVVLVTALESREDRERGIDAGANAYIVKSSFDQSNLLEVVRRLI